MEVKTGAENLFTDNDQSQFYSLYRPNPPEEVINKITTFIEKQIKPPFKQAVDVGCGSGQSTSSLAPHFSNVLGVDVSDSQIKEAIKRETNKNIVYKTGACDAIPLPDTSAELVTCCQAVHWFHLPSFYKEVDRLLYPGGVLALYCYGFPKPYGEENSEEMREHMSHLYNVDTAGCWHENRKIVDALYKDMELPYEEQERDRIVTQDMIWTLKDFVGYIQSWSGYQELKKRNPEKAKQVLQNYQDKMMKTLNVSTAPENIKINFRQVYNLLMARKPV